MATVTFFSAVNMSQVPFSVQTLNGPNSSQFTLLGGGTSDTYGGSFATAGNSVVGTVQSVTMFQSGALAERISGLSLDASTIVSLGMTAQTQALQMLEFAGDDQVFVAAAKSNIKTYSGNDHITLTGGGNTLDGGTGVDTVNYTGKLGDYTVAAFGDTIVATTTGLKPDALLGVERIKFSDALMAYDVNGDAGQAYRLYQAAFARTPDQAGVSFWIAAMDAGTSAKTVAQSFVSSGEFQAVYGANPSAAQIINGFYTNVLGRSADSTGLSYWSAKIQSGMSIADVLINFSESSENHLKVDPVILQGIALDPHLVYV